MRSTLALASLVLVGCADDPSNPLAGPEAEGLERAPLGVRLNDVQVKGVHNAYERDEALPDQVVWHRIRALELDVHTSKSGSPSVPGDWYVYHGWPDLSTSCELLSDCLTELGAWHRDHPNHDLLTLMVDLKDGFSVDWTEDDLDAQLVAALGSALYTPDDLLAACPGAANLRAAVTGACDWPTLDTLRGKVMVQVTGASHLSAYAGSDAEAATRAGFIARDAASAADVSAAPGRAVFFNLDVANRSVATSVRSAGLISRVYGVNSSADWSSAASYGANQLATDKVNFEVDTWARTHNSRGFPFQCVPGAVGCSLGSADEELQLLLLKVDSGDIWGTSDSFAFLHETFPAGQTHTWTAGVSTENSHIEDYGKGCLMARSGTTAGAQYLAVCRPADVHEARVQIRASNGASTTATEVDLTPAGLGMAESSVWHLRLQVRANCARGSASADGLTWTTIAERCFSRELVHQGIAVSSHSDGLHRYVFSKTALDGAPMDQADFDSFRVFGGASASAFDGLYEVNARVP